MKITVIWLVTPSEKKNQNTFDALKAEVSGYKGEVQILAYKAPKAWRESRKDFPAENASLEYIVGFGKSSVMEIYRDAAGRIEDGGIVTAVTSGDTFSGGLWQETVRGFVLHPSVRIAMAEKQTPDKEPAPFGSYEGLSGLRPEKICLDSLYGTYPYYFEGTFLASDLLKSYAFPETPRWDEERRMFLDLCAGQKGRELLYLRGFTYHVSSRREGDYIYFPGIYEEDYYIPSLRDFWIPYLKSLKEAGSIPRFIQYHAMFSLNCRLQSNWNNRNKHVIPEGREEECLLLMGEICRLLEEEVVFNAAKLPETAMNNSLSWVMGILRNGADYHFDIFYLTGKEYYGAGDVVYNMVANLKTNIQFMDFREGLLEVDGTVHPLLYSMADEVYFLYDEQKIPIHYNGRYGLTKVFGVSIYRSHGFHISVPITGKKDACLRCCARKGDREIQISYNFESHFSRMSNRFTQSYWWFGGDRPFLMTLESEALRIRRVEKEQHKKQERKLRREMFSVGIHQDRRALLFILIRFAFFFMKPIMKRRPIWMYLDKIYKAGDSSEYLYKYASRQDNHFKHYYLVDKKSPDYARLKKEGFHPLVRGSIKHRLVFLMADMMVISNSTVYAFNNFGMINSSYIRDLPDFHVCCVQHGMSVQKIALAQTRLRDNTRLYFCASRYELKNLIHPVYDYQGYDALKLTGVPRYDGLVNDDKKQIMISPTWRMQAAVPVEGSEGEQRKYNPLFKKSPYFKVYNALINDPRLIEAAREYGYKIKYVLHPIVSSQVDDFTKNDYVDIIPAAGDMSYERMFCESSLMVTDFSGIQFDFAYMRKPLVYLHHKDIPQHYEEGSFFYDTMAFGEICHDNEELVDLLIDYMKNGCRMKEEYVRRADDFFYYDDHNNCQRIYDIMVAYQEKYVLGAGSGWPQRIQNSVDISGRDEAAERALMTLADHAAAPKGKTIGDDYYEQQVQEKTVLMLGLGHGVRGSLQYILNELNTNPLYEDFQVFVRANRDSVKTVREYIKNNQWIRTRAVVSDRQYAMLMESAKYLICETYFPDGWVKKEGQISINIWHGTPWKKLGLAKNQKNLHKDGNTQKNFIDADYLMYPNDYTFRNMTDSYKVGRICTGKAAMIGYPRTGGMLQALHSDQSALKDRLAPGGEKLYAYMPTWKAYLTEEEVVAETRELLEYLDTVLQEDQILYCNLHHKVSDVIDYRQFVHIRQFPADVDSYALLAATEALITDYSSVFFDYLATRKQIILYCADYELYRKKRGVYMEISELPFDQCRTMEEVIEAINRGKTYDDTEVFERFCHYDSEENAARLCSLFFGEFFSDQMDIRELPKNDRKKVLVYSERYQPSEMTDAIELMSERCRKDKKCRCELYLSGEMFAIDEQKERAYPLLKVTPVIGSRQDLHFSGKGKAIKELYEAGEIPFDEYLDYMQYDLVLAPWRMYGHAKFDTVFMVDIQDPERLLIFSLMDAERLLFITPEMVRMVRDGDHRMADAIRFTVPRCVGVYAFGEETGRELLSLMPDLAGQIPVQKELLTGEEKERAAMQRVLRQDIPVFNAELGLKKLVPYPTVIRPAWRRAVSKVVPKGVRAVVKKCFGIR